MTPVVSMESRTRWLALIVLCLGDLMIVLDTTIVNVALPSIRSDLGFSETSLAWVVNAYLLTFGGFLLLGGRLGDLFGHRRLFLIGITLFTLASLACGLSTTQGLLVAARAIQGLGGAIVSAVALSLMMTLFTEPAERAKAMGVFGFVAAGRRQHRRAARRSPDRRARLALDLPRQRPDRGRGLRSLAEAAAGRPRAGRRWTPRRRRRDHRDGLADARRLRDRERQRHRLDVRPDPRPARRLGHAARDLPPHRDSGSLTARAAPSLPPAERGDRERRRRPLGRRHVRLVLPLCALPPARARVQPAAGRSRVPTGQPDHGSLLARPVGEARHALRPQAAAGDGAAPGRGRARALRARAGRRDLRRSTSSRA